MSDGFLPAEGPDPALELRRAGGPPRFLLVHGSSGSAAVWEGLMAALAERGAGSLALSLRGHGASGGRARLQEWGIGDYLRDVRRTLALFSEPPVLVGHSMGGLVAQLTAAEVALERLVLLAPSPVGGMGRDGMRMVLRHPLTFWRAIRRRSFLALYEDPRVCRALLFARETPEEVVHAHQARLQEESWRAGSELNTLLPAPAAVRCPVRVIGGAEDRMVGANSLRRTAAAYGTEAIFLPGRAHMVQLEGSMDELAAAIL